jgi:aldose 1-epimerase
VAKLSAGILVLMLGSILVSSSVYSLGAENSPRITKQSFGNVEGQEADLYTLSNKHGMEVSITNYGAIVVSIKVPDSKGSFEDVVAGYDSAENYVSGRSSFGATIGRYANRIARGQFTLDGVTYALAKNNGPNHLHGGIKGFSKVLWSADDISKPQLPVLRLHYLSRDGEEGYPGNLNVSVTFTLTDKNELKINYEATTDKDTVINLTNHSYFNLAGSGDILNDQLTIFASRFTPVDAGLIPTGELRPVEGTPFDFRKPTAIGAHINDENEQLKRAKGYDVNLVLDAKSEGKPKLGARVVDPKTGRILEVWTTEPAIQFYTANSLDGSAHGKGKTYQFHSELCLETQHFPDSPNHANFPSTVLRPGDPFHSETIYRFYAK